MTRTPINITKIIQDRRIAGHPQHHGVSHMAWVREHAATLDELRKRGLQIYGPQLEGNKRDF
jgi:hypothetical protein